MLPVLAYVLLGVMVYFGVGNVLLALACIFNAALMIFPWMESRNNARQIAILKARIAAREEAEKCKPTT